MDQRPEAALSSLVRLRFICMQLWTLWLYPQMMLRAVTGDCLREYTFNAEDSGGRVRLAYPGYYTRAFLRFSLGIFFMLLTVASFTPALPAYGQRLSESSLGRSGASVSGTTGLPTGVGASPLPDLSLPKTVVSSVNGLVGAGGVIRTSPQNITLYN